MQLARQREWREARGLAQRELAAAAGVSAKTISRLEDGDSARTTTASKIARALGVTVMDLMEDPPVPLAQAPLAEVQPETGRSLSVPIHDSVSVDDDVKAAICEHLDALRRELEAHNLNGALRELVEQMREAVLAA